MSAIKKDIFLLEDTIQRLQELMLDQVSQYQELKENFIKEEFKLTMSAVEYLQELQKLRQEINRMTDK